MSVKVELIGENRELQQEIQRQLKSMPGGRLTTRTSPEKRRVLGVDQVVQWVLEHPAESYAIVRTVVDVIRLGIRKLVPARTERQEGKKAEKIVRVEVYGKTLELPASDATVQKFLKQVSGEKGKDSSSQTKGASAKRKGGGRRTS